MARRGELDSDQLDIEWLEAIELHDLMEMTNWTWSIEDMENASSITLTRLLQVHRATIDAGRPKE